LLCTVVTIIVTTRITTINNTKQLDKLENKVDKLDDKLDNIKDSLHSLEVQLTKLLNERKAS
jgi:peptidoglycan hydrolase CwlO-like protein